MAATAHRTLSPERAARAAPGRQAAFLLMLPALVLLGVFFVTPYLYLLYMSFMTHTTGATYIRVFTFENYLETVQDPFNWRIIWQTLRFGFVTSFVTLLLSYPLAYHMARASSRVKGLLMIMLLSPLLVGIVVRSYGWMILLADQGLINQAIAGLGLGSVQLMYNETGVMIGLIHIYMPFMVLSLLGSLQAIDPDLERAARSLGAGTWQTLRRVTWPLSLPGVTSGTVLVFVLTVSAFVIPSLLGGYRVLTLPLLVVQMVEELFNWPAGSAMAIVFFVITIAIVGTYLKVMDRAMRGVA
ncbi:MAG: ABC transporter permease [Chloroflexota bacterium]|nr:ABC transporter permease [Chloroflexota bacterium]